LGYWQARRQDIAAGGGQKPEGGAKNQKRGHIFKMQCWMYAATGGPNVKLGSPEVKVSLNGVPVKELLPVRRSG